MRFVLCFNLLMCTNLKIFMDPRYCKRIDLGSKRSPTPPKKQCEDYGTGQFLELSGALLLREIPHCRSAKCCRDAITLQRRLVDGEGGW